MHFTRCNVKVKVNEVNKPNGAIKKEGKAKKKELSKEQEPKQQQHHPNKIKVKSKSKSKKVNNILCLSTHYPQFTRNPLFELPK